LALVTAVHKNISVTVLCVLGLTVCLLPMIASVPQKARVLNTILDLAEVVELCLLVKLWGHVSDTTVLNCSCWTSVLLSLWVGTCSGVSTSTTLGDIFIALILPH